MNEAEREAQYRQQWVSYIATVANELGDYKSVVAMARHLSPWAGHQTIWGYAYNTSTAKTRALFCALKWYLYLHSTKRFHSKGCIAQYQAALDTVLEVGDAIEAFEAKWPRYCRQCGGAGMHHEPAHNYPDGSGDPPSDEPCEGCVGQGRCPLCGHQHDEEWDGDCCDECIYGFGGLRLVSPSWDQARDLECVCGAGQ